MKTSLKMLLAAGLLSTAALAVTPASAQPSSFSFRVGNVAMGFSDGYYDRDHRWHRWHSAREHRWYRANNASFYHDSRRRGSWDRDGDGVPNRYDSRPNNPYRN